MKLKNIVFLLVTGILFLSIYGCANQGPSPAGGPQDTIPPTIINSVPQNQALNFKGSELYFEFDERITADKLKEQLIITPNTEIEYSFISKKERLYIKLQTPLADSTTYSFNFLDGVTDITERNPVFNFKLAFSTGSFIDSMSVEGVITNLTSGEPQKEFTIGLYDIKDTIDVFEKKPKYFISTKDDGSYLIQNIKSGDYRIFAWKDVNRNLTLETESEAYGFIADTIHLQKEVEPINIPVTRLDAREPKVLSARQLGKYFNIKYNKEIDNYHITSKDSGKILSNNFIKSDKLVRLYNSIELNETDSLIYYITATDSLLQKTMDTVIVKFTSSKKNPDPFSRTLINKSTTIKDTLEIEMSFNKPIGIFNKDSLAIAIDSVAYFKLDSTSSFTWNKNRTNIQWKTPINWQYFNDSIESLNKNFIYLDSIETDTTKKGQILNIKKDLLFFLIKKGAFLSIEKDSLKTESIKLNKEIPEDFSKIFLTINTAYENYWVEVIDSNSGNVIRQIKVANEKKIVISKLEPGKYKFRCKIDENNDGIWSKGNIKKNIEPEKVINTDLETSTKANFELNIELTF